MTYLHRHADARRHPDAVLAGVRSVVMVAISYSPHPGTRRQGAGGEGEDSLQGWCQGVAMQSIIPRTPNPSPPRPGVRGGEARVARYALGTDYHDVIRDKLNRLRDWVQDQVPGCSGRGVVDTAPLLERDFARRAGLGWFGKNTMLLNKHLGSYILPGRSAARF